MPDSDWCLSDFPAGKTSANEAYKNSNKFYALKIKYFSPRNVLETPGRM